jgi:SOS response regulatory protein OraA/RecX
MSRRDKLKARLLARPRDLTFEELRRLLRQLGYEEEQAEGSRVTFYRAISGSIIKLHRPHPRPILKAYQINQVLDVLREEELI